MAIRVPLKLHPGDRCAVKAIEVQVSRLGSRRLELIFFLTGGAKHVARHVAQRDGLLRTELWKSTCFEMFLRAEGEAGYFETNMSPDGGWMVFRFTGRREGRIEADGVTEIRGEWVGGKLRDLFGDHPPQAERWAEAQHEAYVRMMIDLERVHDLPIDRVWHLGLCAVIEENGGRKSYWALAHPEGPADFHDPACFALELPAAREA